MIAIGIIITVMIVLLGNVIYLHWKVKSLERRLVDMCISSYNSLGVAMTVMLNKEVDAIKAMQQQVEHLIETEKYEEAMKLRKEIAERQKHVDETVQAFNQHSVDLRLGTPE